MDTKLFPFIQVSLSEHLNTNQIGDLKSGKVCILNGQKEARPFENQPNGSLPHVNKTLSHLPTSPEGGCIQFKKYSAIGYHLVSGVQMADVQFQTVFSPDLRHRL